MKANPESKAYRAAYGCGQFFFNVMLGMLLGYAIVLLIKVFL